ncbi:hypothetical protein [Streptomyces sp. KR80]|uniref:hypothetical protein n=1 Tax=Streptomyces sp. KR80 TaxID=3457426 RepID=UPI003FD0EA97
MNSTSRRRPVAAAIGLGLAAALTAVACGESGSPSDRTKEPECIKVVDEESGEETGKCLPIAPQSERVDRGDPEFSRPTKITNPLHPSARIEQAIYGGQVDGKPFRTEVTKLPETKTITWRGEKVQTVVSQYAAFSDGRIQEVALDWFAQADDGSVWYFGEDVFNYEDGVVADTAGTWIAGDTAPAAMIMPDKPEKGDVYRPENAPGVVFEEVHVKNTAQTVEGPYQPVKGAITVGELHMDGSREDKIFAPGYGEFAAGTAGGDLEKVSLAIPTDARPGPVPKGLDELSIAVLGAFDTAGKNDRSAAQAAADRLLEAWNGYRSEDEIPELLDRQMSRDIESFGTAAANPGSAEARTAALRVAQNALDLRLRYTSVDTVDQARLQLWARQTATDAAAGDEAAVAGDVTALELIRDRIKDSLAADDAERLDAHLDKLRTAADGKDSPGAADEAKGLLTTVTGLKIS